MCAVFSRRRLRKRLRGGLVSKVHRLVYHSTPSWRVIKKKKVAGSGRTTLTASTSNPYSPPSQPQPDTLTTYPHRLNLIPLQPTLTASTRNPYRTCQSYWLVRAFQTYCPCNACPAAACVCVSQFRVQGFWVSGFGFLVSGFWFRVSGFGFRPKLDPYPQEPKPYPWYSPETPYPCGLSAVGLVEYSGVIHEIPV